MAFWRSSDVFGINYHMMLTPDSHNYFTGDPVSSPGGAAAEVLLTASVAMNHNAVLWNIWNRGIAPLETQIIDQFKQIGRIEREVETATGKDVNSKNFGVLLIATVYQSAVINQDTKAPQRSYHGTHIETYGFDYKSALKIYNNRDKLIPAKQGWKTVHYHIWAVRS
jgi:hypothetical protein